MTLTLKGAADLKRLLQQTPDAIRDRVAGLIATSTHSVAARMRSNAAHRSGDMAGTITPEAQRLRGRVWIGAYYWRFLEFGTRYMSAQPFVRSSVELETPAFERGLREIDRRSERDFAIGWVR